MEKFYNAVCWIGLGILLIFGLVVLIYRAVGIAYVVVWMVLFSSLPWWERILAPAAVIAGIAFLVRRSGPFSGHGIPRNKNFVYYTSKPEGKPRPDRTVAREDNRPPESR